MSPRHHNTLESIQNEETPLTGLDVEEKLFSTSLESRIPKSIKQKIKIITWLIIAASSLIVLTAIVMYISSSHDDELAGLLVPIGPYKLTSVQEGKSFFDNYKFFDGADSLGSAGYNVYVGKDRAMEKLHIANVTTDEKTGEEFVFMKSSPTAKGPRESVRIEGNTRYNHGLFILDVRHMPAGPGVWPAWWLTDEDSWPYNGEIDIVEGINYQTVAKTALHTSDRCSMFAHVPAWKKTGEWDRATGLPDTFTGVMDFNTSKPADDCWEMAPHQWFNQGCVLMSDEEGTIGQPLNAKGGGLYVLEWDPNKEKAIRSWVFPAHAALPTNLEQAIQTASSSDYSSSSQVVIPNPDEWGLPYAYFAVGDETGCSKNHFQNMRIVFNLAFCGTVAGNRFFADCPNEASSLSSSSMFDKKHKDDPIASCNDYIKSNPSVLEEAYWKIKGLYVYERSMKAPAPNSYDDTKSTRN